MLNSFIFLTYYINISDESYSRGNYSICTQDQQ